MSIVHTRTKDRLVLRIKDALDSFTVEGNNIVMLRTLPGKDGIREKSVEAIFSPEWIHEIDSWYQEYQNKLINSIGNIAEYEEFRNE